jgi:replicative DNA helicase
MMNPELAMYEALAKELLRMILAEEEPTDIHKWLLDKLSAIGVNDESAILTWAESFDLTSNIVDHYETLAKTPENERKILSWPWQSWRSLIEPLEEGMLGVVTAPDGAGKTIYGESIAEHWAMHKNHVVFVHYELNRRLMMLRRTARHTGITVRKIKSGELTSDEKKKISSIKPKLLSWDGYITYLHTPGWSMEKVISELRRLKNEGECDAVVLDYLEKAGSSKRQLQMFGNNVYQREADNVEQLKTFSESTEVPVLMIAQMTKEAKSQSFQRVDRTGMRGSGEKSDKANLVVLLSRERIESGYSAEVDVFVDKNTMGATGIFKQIMKPEHFSVFDIAKDKQDNERYRDWVR